ncbi:hypothetical protein HYH03_008404 [Edaphochlamys debaryana]|uniref:BTB domain-containing protein n=1 Tax=Edaphochlamys debaryana TaxID=47281 RepID=A0A835Y112_9CHLO|nr:hypothetical protein HYH03_008404 [Edaphochlamys debaryana]|eukprot:KAG2493267.1 hypothetical protein HYH03_008404 [Edaphochlamys debaryana]
MALTVRTVPLPSKATGLAVRPRPSGSDSSGGDGPFPEPPDQQILVFTDDGAVHELLGCGSGGSSAGDLRLGPPLAKPGCHCLYPTYDPSTGAVHYCDRALGSARARVAPSLASASSFQPASSVSRLEPSNDCSHLAGSRQRSNSQEATFMGISSLVADGQGGLWVADLGSLQRLDTRSGNVTATFPNAELPGGSCYFAFEVGGGTLLAASGTAVSRLCAEVGGGVELVAGGSEDKGSVDGVGAAARFADISSILPVPGGRMLIADGPNLRCMDAGGAVTTLLQGCFLAGGRVTQLTTLPSGDLAALCGGGASLVLITGVSLSPTPSTDKLIRLLGPRADDRGEDSSGGGAVDPSLPGTVVVRVGDRAFPAHRSVLAAGSEYFARLLAPGGGFAESGAAEVALPDADPAAFAHLLSYMYGSTFGVPCAPLQLLQSVPFELLRPAAALAGRLLMGEAVVSAFTDRLAAAAAPSTVMSTLIWAEDHGLEELAAGLRVYAIEHRKSLDLSALAELIAAHPKRASEVVSELLRA